MSDVDFEVDSISDLTNALSDDDGSEASSISPAVRELCDRLRANDPRFLDDDNDYDDDGDILRQGME